MNGRRRIPTGIKLLYTAHLAVLVPVYWYHYGPTNFLYFCDVSLFLAAVAMWRESPVWAGVPAVGLFLPQLLWNVDFVVELCGGHLLGMTSYMFDPNKPLYLRGLSLFHGWLPFLLLWLVLRLGYDRRSFVRWTVLAWGLMVFSYLCLPAPPAPADQPNLPTNVNYVYGFSEMAPPQSWLPPLVWLVGIMVLSPLVMWWPTHRLFVRIAGRSTAA